MTLQTAADVVGFAVLARTIAEGPRACALRLAMASESRNEAERRAWAAALAEAWRRQRCAAIESAMLDVHDRHRECLDALYRGVGELSYSLELPTWREWERLGAATEAVRKQLDDARDTVFSALMAEYLTLDPMEVRS